MVVQITRGLGSTPKKYVKTKPFLRIASNNFRRTVFSGPSGFFSQIFFWFKKNLLPLSERPCVSTKFHFVRLKYVDQNIEEVHQSIWTADRYPNLWHQNMVDHRKHHQGIIKDRLKLSGGGLSLLQKKHKMLKDTDMAVFVKYTCTLLKMGNRFISCI